MKLSRFMAFVFPFLILGNLACMVVGTPYLLIGLRAFCGIGFAFLKYWLNSIVAAGSKDDESFSINCGRLNAGLLGGITVGASLGAILAESLGYQSNYMFTAIILGILLVWALLTTPWKLLQQLQGTESAEEESHAEKGNLGGVLKNPKVLLTILFGCVPLNIGLMYVVAFVPSYMDCIGQTAIATSYVYLINGLAGVYIGMIVLNLLKKKSLYMSASLALFVAAGGMLVLLVSKSLGIILLSAGILGLFDGFGTPSITSYFTGLSSDKSETAGMLTAFNMVGSAVQILCPMLYNVLIQPDGKTTYLAIFAVAYAVVAVLFTLFCRPAKTAKKVQV
jgi:predicted MFS family arabinose efflux permease